MLCSQNRAVGIVVDRDVLRSPPQQERKAIDDQKIDHRFEGRRPPFRGGPMGVVDQSLVWIREPSSLVGSSECPCPPVGARRFDPQRPARCRRSPVPFSILRFPLFSGQRFAKIARAVLVIPRISTHSAGIPPFTTCSNSDPCGKFHAPYEANFAMVTAVGRPRPSSRMGP